MQAGDLDVRVDVHGRDELAELAAAFNGMAARIAETERLRRQMVSDVAHELRSPVTNLRCTLESIQDGLAVPDRASIDALHEETLFLQRLVSDLQDLTLADAGQLALHVRPVDLRDVIRRAAAAMPATAGQPSVHIDCPERLPDVQGDRDRLEQVFRNILSNARTHTPADGRIEVRAWEDGRWIHVEVVDTGAGIDAAHVAHVFDRFYRADTSRSRDTGGAGLGLAIALQLVTAHGGDISAASDGLGKGARFCVRLPVLQ
jgi:two-component system sensor histidine kinase BaeS